MIAPWRQGHEKAGVHQFGRRAVDSQAALALDAALRCVFPDGQFSGETVAEEEGQQP